MAQGQREELRYLEPVALVRGCTVPGDHTPHLLCPLGPDLRRATRASPDRAAPAGARSSGSARPGRRSPPPPRCGLTSRSPARARAPHRRNARAGAPARRRILAQAIAQAIHPGWRYSRDRSEGRGGGSGRGGGLNCRRSFQAAPGAEPGRCPPRVSGARAAAAPAWKNPPPDQRGRAPPARRARGPPHTPPGPEPPPLTWASASASPLPLSRGPCPEPLSLSPGPRPRSGLGARLGPARGFAHIERCRRPRSESPTRRVCAAVVRPQPSRFDGKAGAHRAAHSLARVVRSYPADASRESSRSLPSSWSPSLRRDGRGRAKVRKDRIRRDRRGATVECRSRLDRQTVDRATWHARCGQAHRPRARGDQHSSA